MAEWVEVEPVHGARTWVLCVDGVPIDGDELITDDDFSDEN